MPRRVSNRDREYAALFADLKCQITDLELKNHEIHKEWESSLSREMSTFAELKERREEIEILNKQSDIAYRRINTLARAVRTWRELAEGNARAEADKCARIVVLERQLAEAQQVADKVQQLDIAAKHIAGKRIAALESRRPTEPPLPTPICQLCGCAKTQLFEYIPTGKFHCYRCAADKALGVKLDSEHHS